MAKPSNMGTYNQNLQFRDENPFQKAFNESREEAKNLAEEAYTKKKGEFINKFYEDLRYKIMMPEGTDITVPDDEHGGVRLNKGFYDIANTSPEQILRMAKREARKAGLNPASLSRNEILSDELKSLYNEAAKRQFKELAVFRDMYGEEATMDVLRKEGHNFLQFYHKFYDPWMESPLETLNVPENMMAQKRGGQDVRARDTAAWYKKHKANGWSFNSKGQVTGIPGAFDPSEPVDVQWDDNGDAYIPRGKAANQATTLFDMAKFGTKGYRNFIETWKHGPYGGKLYIDE